MLVVEYRLLQNGRDTGRRFFTLADAKEGAEALLSCAWKITWVEDKDTSVGRWFGSAPSSDRGPALRFQIQRAEHDSDID